MPEKIVELDHVASRLPASVLEKKSPTPDAFATRQQRDVDLIGRALWINCWISTGSNVRNCRVLRAPLFCPVSIRSRRKVCPTGSTARKPLSMWKKSRLSTVRPAFTITTILIFLSKLTKEGKRAGSTRTRFCLQKKNVATPRHRRQCSQQHECRRRHCSTSVLSTERTRRTRRIRNMDRLTARLGEAANALPACKNCKQSVQIGCKTSPAVENRLHIHRTGCAKKPFCRLPDFLSNIGSASIQCFSSRSVIA